MDIHPTNPDYGVLASMNYLRNDNSGLLIFIKLFLRRVSSSIFIPLGLRIRILIVRGIM